MNPLLERLQPYPFERWRALTQGLVPNPALKPISLGIGEPRHATPALVEEALVKALPQLSSYPATAGEPALRLAIADWVQRRYGVAVDAATQVLPVNGSREALFALAQTVIDARQPGATVVCPNPFYQIYEGAALLAGAEVVYVPGDAARNFATDWNTVDATTWARTQLLFVCSPGNPAGAVMGLAEWRRLFELSDRHGFVICSDECYSEIYFGDQPPLGALQAAQALGRHDFRRLVALTSLSKRSNVPGLRSGFAAGDAALIKAFLLYRTYHGSAMGGMVQRASIAAWSDEAHVQANRALYRRKFEQVMPLLQGVLDVALPDAAFYLWAALPSSCALDDVQWAQGLLAQYNVAVLPGSLLARAAASSRPLAASPAISPARSLSTAPTTAPATTSLTPATASITPATTAPADPANPGHRRIRMALVAPLADCLEAAQRIVSYSESL